jgi:hypothetical protein
MKLRFSSPAQVKEEIRLPYSCSVEDFQKQLALRSGPAGMNARSKALAFLSKSWGIDAGDFSLSGIWLPRQMARPDGEAFVTAAFAQMCDVSAGILELTFDAYVDCAYKRSFTKQNVLSERDGRAYLEQYPVPANGTCLDELDNGKGQNVMELLRATTGEFLGGVGISDISGFYSRILGMNIAAAAKGTAPAIGNVMVKTEKLLREFVFMEGKYRRAGQEYSLGQMKELADSGLARPSATWNYENIYLLIPGILCPEAALVVTPFELDELKIRSSAFSAVQEMSRNFGFPPFLVPMVPMSMVNTQNMARAKSKIGKYPEYASYLLKPESAADVISSGNGVFIDSSFAVAESLAQIAAMKEIKVVQEKRS